MAQVQLYVYDLSNGLAKQLSAQLTGRQIDGIWHTSIVVFGKEVFYGQGINICSPGRSHHGQPLQVVDLGETAIDQETWQEYLDEMRDHYTADKYHLLDFNCNSFTNDCAGFLTGGSIPTFVKDLPTDFLSTPFGAAMRPTIDAMYRRPTPGASAVAPPPPNQPIAASLLQAVAAQAQASSSNAPPRPAAPPLAATESLAGSLHPSTNSASFRALLRSHRAVVAFFTDFQGCPPCRMITPLFEQLAAEKGARAATGGRGAAFTKIDIRVGTGGTLATEWGVRATPTFMFFLNGTKIAEVKGANAGELRTQIDLLLFQAYPPHPHTSLSLTAVKAISLAPILFTQVPALDAVFAKFVSFIDATPSPSTTVPAKELLRTQVIPYLKGRFAPVDPAPGSKASPLPSATPMLLTSWASATTALLGALSTESLFPLVDMWRLALLDPAAATWLAAAPGAGPIGVLARIARDALAQSTQDKGTRNYVLTTLRLLANAFKSAPLARVLLSGGDGAALGTLVPALLHSDATVRTAAASLAFNAAASVQRARVATGSGLGGVNVSNASADDADAAMAADEDWQVELTSALVEALEREGGEDVVHRLVAALACLLRFMPEDGQVRALVEVLAARAVVLGKLKTESVQKKDVRKLVEEVASLCPS
ncbi:PPPDE putative peptidase domain-containing protein [Mycena alexandri]|uniref:PPPDE putative peptidase domain-containing protein n=1 Tax=Mycena alexandri TaxID=1745969 RepID=A0AAD6TEP8_9AGAR|nr:PPPDE putative peptidase domain-containing protein [Mycena alexandri]